MNDTGKTATPDTSNPLDTLDMCCGGKKCPIVEDFGDRVVTTDGGKRVEYTREQASNLRAWLVRRGY